LLIKKSSIYSFKPLFRLQSIHYEKQFCIQVSIRSQQRNKWYPVMGENVFFSWRLKKRLIKVTPTFVKNVYFKRQKKFAAQTWFSKAQPEFEKFLLPLKFHDLKFLQIGAFRGDASKWMLQEVLISPNSILFDVDTWEGSAEHLDLNERFSEVEIAYDRNILGIKNVVKKKMTSDVFFATNNLEFDFIYIDGDHHRDQVALDAKNALRVCRTGGIIAFDDYGWDVMDGSANRPKEAVDNFLSENADQIKILHNQYQIWVKVIRMDKVKKHSIPDSL